jgi:putative ABC transport system permease protein
MLPAFRLAFRSLRRSRTFALLAVSCIGLGIGVTTTMFSAVSAVLLRPLPFHDADDLVVIYARHREQGLETGNVSYPDYQAWKSETTAFSGMGLFNWLAVTLSGQDDAERISGAEITADLFSVLGVQPVLGRGFTEDEVGRESRAPVVLLGYDLWQRRYGGNPSIIGQSVNVDGAPFTVVGVMPRGFRFPENGEVWVPLELESWAMVRGNRFLAAAIARLAPGHDFAGAQAELAVISERLVGADPQANLGWDARILPLREDLLGGLRFSVLLLFGAVGMVLLIACANVSNLLLARGSTRRKEIAVRLAIGAGRRHVVREMLAESLLIGLGGGAIGILLAAWSLDVLGQALARRMPSYAELRLDLIVLAFAAGISIATALLFGLLPALQSTRADLRATLQEGSRGTAGPRRTRARGVLVASEVALTLVLLSGATLLVKSLDVLRSTDLGFDERNVLTMRIYVPPARYPTLEERGFFYTKMLDRLRTLPDVEAAGAAQGIPFSGWNVGASIVIEGMPKAPPGREPGAHYQYVTTDFFRALSVPLIRGRGIEPRDRTGAPLVGLVNQSFVERFLPGQDPIGKRVGVGGPDEADAWTTIVGVVGDYRHYALSEPMGPALYFAYDQSPRSQMDLAIRTTGDPLDVLPAVRRVLADLDAQVPAFRVRTLEDATAEELWVQRLLRDLFSIFASLAFLLATVGVYGVIAYNVAQRRQEIGVRVALGARGGDIVRLVVGQGVRLAAIGGAIGLVAAVALARVLSAVADSVDASDPFAFLAAAAAVGAGALLACWLPARRAARIDPLTALRSD